MTLFWKRNSVDMVKGYEEISLRYQCGPTRPTKCSFAVEAERNWCMAQREGLKEVGFREMGPQVKEHE